MYNYPTKKHPEVRKSLELRLYFIVLGLLYAINKATVM